MKRLYLTLWQVVFQCFSGRNTVKRFTCFNLRNTETVTVPKKNFEILYIIYNILYIIYRLMKQVTKITMFQCFSGRNTVKRFTCFNLRNTETVAQLLP